MSMAFTSYPVSRRLNVKDGYDQSVQIVTRAICWCGETFTTLKTVVRAVDAVPSSWTWKYGRRSVAAGATPMSQESSLFVVEGAMLDEVAAKRFPVSTRSRRNDTRGKGMSLWHKWQARPWIRAQSAEGRAQTLRLV